MTERDCATDGDMESQGRREQEWGGVREGPESRCREGGEAAG